MTDTRARGESPRGERDRGRIDDADGGSTDVNDGSADASGESAGVGDEPTDAGHPREDRDGSPDSTEAGFRVRHAVTEREGVSFVRTTVENPAPVDRRVRVENRLAGAVLPPRRDGVPEEGWDEDGFVGTVPAGGTRTLGYACEAPPTHPPVAVSGRGRADEDESAPSPTDVVRTLGRAAPPGDAVPSAGKETSVRDDGSASIDPEPPSPDPEPLPAAADDRTAPADAGAPKSDGHVAVDAAAAEAWLDAVEARVELGERLTGASLATATDAVADAGGIDAVADLPETLAADAATLDAVAGRAARLAERARETDVPAGALERLA